MKKRRYIIAVSLVATVLVAAFAIQHFQFGETLNQSEFYVGVAFCGNTTAEANMLIDRVKEYSNLFILQSGPISMNLTATNEICDYATAAKMNIIVYFGDLDPTILAKKNLEWRTSWIDTAKSRWGEQFLGVYYYDERGGIYLDTDKNATQWRLPLNATYDTAANIFINGFLKDPGTVALKNKNVPIFESDYGLYWFDYLSGYDVVLAQAGWNHSLVQDIDLVKGAANMQHKDWGVIITWKYDQPPYLASGNEIYQQMASAYEAGAKYIAIFNYPYNNTNSYGTMQYEHFEALQKFWNDIAEGKIARTKTKADAVLVLPKNYGWGMRNPQDSIWGFWEPDDISSQIWALSRKLIAQYGFSLDIVYDDVRFPVTGKYVNLYYWNANQTS